jgi:hypothetical protein
MSSRVKCTCGTRIKLPKGQPLPVCSHIAPSSVVPAGGWAGVADYFQFFTPRADHKDKKKGWLVRKPGTDGRRHTPPAPTSSDLDKGHRRVDAPRASKPVSIRVERESRRLAAEVHKRAELRRTWTEILAHLGRATPKQIEAYRSHILGGLTIPQIAAKLDLTERAIKDRIELARRHERTSRRRARIA